MYKKRLFPPWRLTQKYVSYLFCSVIILHVGIIYRFRYSGRELNHWTKETNRNMSHYANTFTIQNFPAHICEYETELLAVIFSKPENVRARNAIRRSWGTFMTVFNFSMLFLLGQKANFNVEKNIQRENELNNDLVLGNFIEHYLNLTFKSVTMLNFYKDKHKCKYLMKTDEDVYVNVRMLDALLKNITSEEILQGELVKEAFRNNNYYSKWYSPRYMYLGRKYPSFLAGPAYIVSFKAAQKLYQQVMETPFLHLEDVYVTGILAQKANITRKHHDSFICDKLYMRFVFCYKKEYVIYHSYSPENIIRLHPLL